VFLTVVLVGLWRHGWHFFSLFWPSGTPLALAPLVIPVELMSFLSRPVSLSIRLFANMMAGHTILKVFATFVVMMGLWGVVPLAFTVILTGFELAVSVVQAYIFSVLTCVYLRDAIELH
jgi:F-type H+-transporting ATPase subunit a